MCKDNYTYESRRKDVLANTLAAYLYNQSEYVNQHLRSCKQIKKEETAHMTHVCAHYKPERGCGRNHP